MFAYYNTKEYDTKPTYSSKVLIGNWYEDRFHPDKHFPIPERIDKDGFRTYSSNFIVIPHKIMHPLNTTLKRTKTTEDFSNKYKQISTTENRLNPNKVREVEKQMWRERNLLDGTLRPTTYSRDFRLWSCRPRWMSEANITTRIDYLGDRTNQQNHSHLTPYLPPIDVPRLVAM